MLESALESVASTLTKTWSRLPHMQYLQFYILKNLKNCFFSVFQLYELAETGIAVVIALI